MDIKVVAVEGFVLFFFFLLSLTTCTCVYMTHNVGI